MTTAQLTKALRLLTLIAQYRGGHATPGMALLSDLHPSDWRNVRHIVTA